MHAHYASAGGSGCIATTPAAWTLAAGHNGERPQSAFIGDSAGNCLCPGYQLGGLPPAVTDTLRGLDAHDDELCEGCLHPLQNHGDVDPANQPYGCWACPCGHNEILEESVFEIPLDDAPARLLSDPRTVVANGAGVRISVGWITLRMSGSDSIVMQLRMPDLGLSTTISTLDRFWSDLSLRRPCEVATALTECWQQRSAPPITSIEFASSLATDLGWGRSLCACGSSLMSSTGAGGFVGFISSLGYCQAKMS